MPLEGRDVYHRDDPITSYAGLDFVIAKATQGLGITDEAHRAHVGAASTAGVLTGSYHFLESGDGAAQCDRFLDAVSEVAPRDHLYAVDVEMYAKPPDAPATLHPEPDDLLAFHHRFHERLPGRVLLVYSYPAFWQDVFRGFMLNCAGCRLWTSSLRPDVPRPGQVISHYPQIYGGFADLTLHQYETSPVDRNRYYGTRDELMALAGDGIAQLRHTIAEGDDMIQVLHNQGANESRFVQLTDEGLKVFAPMSSDDLHLVNVIAANGGARIIAVDDARAWATAITHAAK